MFTNGLLGIRVVKAKNKVKKRKERKRPKMLFGGLQSLNSKASSSSSSIIFNLGLAEREYQNRNWSNCDRGRVYRRTLSRVAEATNITMELADKAIGFLLSYISLSIFTYYTFWVIILPFVNNDHFIHRYFLPQEYAILIPVFAGMVLLCFLCIFIGYVMLKSKKKKA